jgi:hypothetical protein
MKIDYLQTVILNHICCNFYRYHNLSSISLLPKKLLEIILKNKYLIKESGDQVITALMHWSNFKSFTIVTGEQNQNEDVSSLIESIDWKQVTFEMILEFILKFSKNIEKFEYEHTLLRLLDSKFGDSKTGILNNILSSIIVIKIEIALPLRRLTLLLLTMVVAPLKGPI